MKKTKAENPNETKNNKVRLTFARDDLGAPVQEQSELVVDWDEQLASASALFRAKNYAEAVPIFGLFLKAQPLHEWASLGLFHSLWKLDRKEEAIAEIRRFRDAGGDSLEYRRLFKDLEKFR